jgi:hypothetical protein
VIPIIDLNFKGVERQIDASEMIMNMKYDLVNFAIKILVAVAKLTCCCRMLFYFILVTCKM